MHTRSIRVAALCLCFSPSLASAHKIHPLQDKYKQDSQTILRRASEPVHEQITQLARACQEEKKGTTNGPLSCPADLTPSRHQGGNKHDALIRGIWWNDDPNQLLFALRQTKFIAWMNDAERIAKCGVNWRGRQASIGPSYYMTYRSHYGDLQFIHAMASRDGEPAAETRQNIMAWAEFAYAVAIGQLDPEAKLPEVVPLHVRGFFQEQSGWTINYLFAPMYRLSAADYTRKMAAGSLLHMIQDSYAAGHAKREFGPSAQCKTGRVVQFHSYTNQDPDSHAEHDRLEAWRIREFTPVQNPVNVSATLLSFIERKADWQEVKEYLQGTVFCIDDSAEDASAGEFKDENPKECRK